MKNLLDNCRTIAINTKKNIEKDYFDENYGFRHIPVLFTNAFSHWFTTAINDLITVQKPVFFESWYEKYASEIAPKMKNINFNKEENLLYFKKNNWDLSAWHYLTEGEIIWLIYPPATIEYLQLNEKLPEASAENGLFINIAELADTYKVKPLKIVQQRGELLFIPPMYAYSQERSANVRLFSKTILTEYNHDNLYAYFRKSEFKGQIKQIILDGFKNTKHLSVYETPTQRNAKQVIV